MLNQNKNLKDIFRKKLYRAVVLPVSLLVLLSSVAYFYQINSTISKQKEFVKEQFFNFFQDHVDNQAKHMQKELNSIGYSLSGIDNAIEDYYRYSEGSEAYKAFEFKKNDRGFLYKPDNIRGSSVVFMPQANPTKKDIVDAYNLEKVDPFVISMVDDNDIVIAGWINMENYLVRYYPYFDMKNILMSDMDLKKFNFYYEGDPQHNPKRVRLWTTPYLDPAMKGWMISKITPIYDNDKFIGIFGFDVSIQKLVENIRNSLPSSQDLCVFITNKDGDILSIDERFRQYLDLKPLESYYDGSSISQEILLPQLYNVFKTTNTRLKDDLKKVYENDGFSTIQSNGEVKYIFKARLQKPQWEIFYVVDQNELLNGLTDVQNKNNKIAMIFLVTFLSLLILILLNLKIRLSKTVVDVTKPIEELSDAINNFDIVEKLPKQKIYEISVLYHSFIDMSKRIMSNKDELKKKVDEATTELKEKIKTIEILKEKLVDQNNHDYLTKLFSRRYGDESLQREAQRAQEKGWKLTVVMLDIDFFKDVNDTLGHQVGDDVLAKLGEVILSSMEDRSIAARFGGEEFLLILPDCDKDKAKEIVQNIRQKYNHEVSKMISIDKGLTISAGIATLPDHTQDHTKLIKLADDALYEAKKDGRDKVVMHN
jgi:diguanylate cyclase (GGDEF)-like protein